MRTVIAFLCLLAALALPELVQGAACEQTVQLDLKVARASGEDSCAGHYLEPMFEVVNVGEEAVALDALQIAFWLKRDDEPKVNWGLEAWRSKVFDASGKLIGNAEAKLNIQSGDFAGQNIQALISFSSPLNLPPYGGRLTAGSKDAALFSLHFKNQSCDDYSNLGGKKPWPTGKLTQNSSWALLLNGDRLCEFTALDSPDPATGIPDWKSPCSCPPKSPHASNAEKLKEPALKPHAAPGCIEAEDYRWAKDSDKGNQGGAYRPGDADVAETGDYTGQYKVVNTQSGEWLDYDLRVASSQNVDINLRHASPPKSPGKVRFWVDGKAVTEALALPVTKGRRDFDTTTFSQIPLEKGKRRLRMEVVEGGAHFNWLCVDPQATPTPIPPTPVPTAIVDDAMEISAAAGRPQLDGKLDDGVWSAAQWKQVSKPSVGEPKGQARFKAAWDSKNLYIGVYAFDDRVPLYANHKDPWDGTAVEIFVDADQSRGESFEKGDYQWVVTFDAKTIRGYHDAPEGLVAKSRVREGLDYEMEVAIPWSALKLQPQAGLKLGINLAVDQAQGYPQRAAAWTAWPGSGPKAWGTLVLAPAGNK